MTMFDKESFASRAKGTRWRITVTNETTGKVEIEHGNVGGGLFVVSRFDDASHPVGTDQGCFGIRELIIICAAKTPVLMREMIKKFHDFEKFKELVRASGMDTSIV